MQFLVPVTNNFRALLFLGDFRKIFSFPCMAVFPHRLSSSGDVLGKMVDYLRLGLAVGACFPSLQLEAEECTQITGVHLEASFLSLCWAKVALYLHPMPGALSICFCMFFWEFFACIFHIESQCYLLPSLITWESYTSMIQYIMSLLAIFPTSSFLRVLVS